jgi:hypothetical protein
MMHFNASSYSKFRNASGFALVVTLIMLVLAAVIVITLLSSASLDRGTAKFGEERYQAELATQNGLEAAKKALTASPDLAVGTPLTATDNFLVVRADAGKGKPPYYYLSKPATGSITYYPLFSSSSNPTTPAVQTKVIKLTVPVAPTYPIPPAVQPPVPPADSSPSDASAAQLVANGAVVKRYPTLQTWQPAVTTQWVEVRDPLDTATAPAHDLPYSRYAFWIEDLGGYLDASVVGNENAGGSHQRTNGTNPNEIALFTIFDSTLATDSGTTPAKTLIDNRAFLFTIPTLQQATSPAPAPTPAGQTDPTQSNLGVRLGIDNGGEQNVIPLGLGYPNEGTPKADLNALIKAADVNGIASAIGATLPNFKNRAGGNTFDYNKNISANIIDYADSAKAPTTDYDPATGNATYRGIGAFPFVVSAYDLNNWVNVTGSYDVQIEVTTYVQLWNLHNIPVTGALTLHYENVDQLQVNTNTVNYAPPPDSVSAAFTMQPNTYKVVVFPTKTYTFPWGPTPPATAGPTTSQSSIPFPKRTKANYVRVLWNGKLADRQNQNLEHPLAPTGMRYNPSRGATNAAWRGNAAPPIYPTTGGVGDPRISFYGNLEWTVAAYDTGSAWGGRLQLGRPAVFAEVKPTTWPDSGHDSTIGTKATGASVKPDVLAGQTVTVAADADKWVSRLSTTGSLQTLAELGNIFDIGEWNYSIPSLNAATNLPDIPSSATPDTKLGSGGGYSLAIGRPEFSRFDTNGERAWQLLDVFGLGKRTSTTGSINLNTASFEALRALATGILQDRDKAILPASLATNFFPPTANAPTSLEDNSRPAGGQADLFADAVIQSRPLLSTSQLQMVTNSLGPFFGNPKQWTDKTPPTEWNDSGREELYAKLLNLTTVRSRNFRIFVTGQSLDKNGRVLSTASKVFQVFLNPTRNATTGALQSQRVEIKYEASL